MTDDWKLTDFDDRFIAVGTLVRPWDAWDDAAVTGVVTDLGEWDGDYDDSLGRAVGINPLVTVRWGDGTEGTFATSEWDYEGWAWDREPSRGKVEELVVAEWATITIPVHDDAGGVHDYYSNPQ